MKTLILAALLAVLTSCGSSGGGSGSAASTGCGSKSLFSLWTNVSSGIAIVLDLSAGSFGNNTFIFQYPGGEQCQSDIMLTGDECSGTADIMNSTYIGGGGGDPGCAGLDGIENYTKSASGLEFCSGGTCVTYQ